MKEEFNTVIMNTFLKILQHHDKVTKALKRDYAYLNFDVLVTFDAVMRVTWG